MKTEGCSWCENFSPPHLRNWCWKPFSGMFTYFYYCYCCWMLLLWLLYYCYCHRWWYLLWGLTCPPIIHFKFITLSATAYYYTVRWSVVTNCYIFLSKKCDNLIKKVRQVLQSSTIITRCYRTHRAKSKKRKQQLDDNSFTILIPDSVFNALRDKFLPWWTIPGSLKNNC